MLAIYIPSILNACQATIFQLIYNEIAYRLTNLENHWFYSSYEKSLISKTIIFVIINNYVVILYTAFLKRIFNGCIQTVSDVTSLNKNNTCDDELEALVRSYYIIAFIKNINEIVTPLISPLI